MGKLALAHAFFCIFMTGLIWLVQVVHYPGFRFVEDPAFSEFHSFHSQRITWIVFPVMSAELLSAIALCANPGGWFWRLNLLGVILIWAATALVSVPIHNQLASGASIPLVAKLTLTNWPRTILWTLRSVALFFHLK